MEWTCLLHRLAYDDNRDEGIPNVWVNGVKIRCITLVSVKHAHTNAASGRWVAKPVTAITAAGVGDISESTHRVCSPDASSLERADYDVA